MSMRDGEVGAALDVGIGFSMWGVRECEISAMGVPREPRTLMRAERSVSPPALCGRSAEVAGDDLPVVAVNAGSRQVQHDAPHRGVYPGAEFQEVFTQGADLGASVSGTRGTQTQFLVEHIGGGAEQAAQLIGEEAGAAGAVDLQAVMQLFDSIFDRSGSANLNS